MTLYTVSIRDVNVAVHGAERCVMKVGIGMSSAVVGND